MRTLPTTYNYTALYQNGIIAHYASVVIYNAAQSSSNDLTNYDGVDLVQQVTLSDNIDDPGITAKLSLQRDVYKKSLAPTNANSKWNQGAPLVFVGLRVAVYFASVPVDVTPTSGDFLLVADLHIDQIEFSRASLEVTATDRTIALLRNTYIDTQRTYGTSAVPIETVMQGIIDDNINTPLGYTSANGKKITMQLPGGSPGFLLALGPTIQKQSVLDALNTLAGNIGWSLRSRWVSSLSAFALCFYNPSRSVATPLFSFPPTVLIDITQAQISKTDIRNFIYGYFTDSTNNNVRQYAVAQDATSQAKYGDPPMKMELSEACTSQINTPTQMAALLSNALADLKDSVCQYQTTVPLFIGAEISDAYKLLADMVIFDSDQSVGLTQLSHTIGRNACNTQMNLNGSLPGQYNRWFLGEARPGISPSTNNLDPAGPTVSLGANVGQIVVNYTVADQANWQTTEVYLSSSTFSQPAQLNGKNQRPTAATLAAKGKQAHFTINALTPGGTYYIAILVIDRDGNVGTLSAVQSVTTQTVGPYHENSSGQQDQLIRNPDLNIYTLGTGQPPDLWVLATYSVTPYADLWNSSFVDATLALSGKQAINFPYVAAARFANSTEWTSYLSAALNNTTYFPSGSTAAASAVGHVFYSKFVPINGSEILNAMVSLRANVAGSTTGTRAIFYILTLDKNNTLAIAASITCVPSTSYQTYSIGPIGVNNFVRYVAIGLLAINNASGENILIDRFYCNRGMAQYATGLSPFAAGNNDAASSGATYVFSWPTETRGCFINIGYTGPTGSGLTILSAGNYEIKLNVYLSAAASTTVTLSIQVTTTPSAGGTWATIGQSAQVVGTGYVGMSCSTTATIGAGYTVRMILVASSAAVSIRGDMGQAPLQNMSIAQTSRPDR